MLHYMDLPKSPGIYLIWCNGNNKPYVGQTNNLWRRIKNHITDLKAGDNSAIKLQRAYDKYGAESLDLHIICECEEHELDKIEQEWLDLFQLEFTSSQQYLNTAMIANSTRGVKHTDETKSKMAKSHSGKPLTDYHKDQIRQALTGREFTPEWIENLKVSNEINYENRREEFTVISPDGIVYTAKGKNRFAREHGLVPGAFSSMLRGNKNHHKGWRRYPLEPDKKTPPFKDYLYFMSLDGVVHRTNNLTELATQYDLVPDSLSKINKGKQKSHKGWTMVTEKEWLEQQD